MGRKIEVLFHFEIMFNELVCSKLPCVNNYAVAIDPAVRSIHCLWRSSMHAQSRFACISFCEQRGKF